MANDAANAIVGKPAVAGGIFVADLGTALPTNESTALSASYKSVGYLTDAGLGRSKKSDTDTKRAWGGDPIVVLDKGTTRQMKFGFAEYLNTVVQQILHGNAQVTETAATSTVGRKLKIVDKDAPYEHKVWVVQMFSGTAVGRIIIPDGQITETEDWVYKDDDIAARPVTLTQFANSSGEFAIEYWNDGRTV